MSSRASVLIPIQVRDWQLGVNGESVWWMGEVVCVCVCVCVCCKWVCGRWVWAALHGCALCGKSGGVLVGVGRQQMKRVGSCVCVGGGELTNDSALERQVVVCSRVRPSSGPMSRHPIVTVHAGAWALGVTCTFDADGLCGFVNANQYALPVWHVVEEAGSEYGDCEG